MQLFEALSSPGCPYPVSPAAFWDWRAAALSLVILFPAGVRAMGVTCGQVGVKRSGQGPDGGWGRKT